MVDIETKYNPAEGQQALQLAKCQFNSTFYGSSYARVYFMRKANFIQKTAGDFDDELKCHYADPEELTLLDCTKMSSFSTSQAIPQHYDCLQYQL